MEDREEALALDIAAVKARLTDIERRLERRLPVVVFAPKPSDDAAALIRHLRPLQTSRDDRSDWRAMLDGWRLRHFAACFGLAAQSGYRWRIEETVAQISVYFEPTQPPAA